MLLVCFIAGFSVGAIAGDTLEIKQDFKKRELGTELSFISGVNPSTSIDEASSLEFNPANGTRPNLGFSEGAMWVKTCIFNSGQTEDFQLIIQQPLLDSITVFVLDEKGRTVNKKLFGESLPYFYRDYRAPPFIIDVEVPREESRTIYIRIVSAEQIVLPVFFATRQGSLDIMQSSNLYFGAYIGLIFALALYNLFLYFTVRDKSYLVYVIYTVAVGLTQAVLEGYMHQIFWPESDWFAARSPYIFTALTSCTAIMFLQEFLRVREHAPKLNTIAKLIYVYFIVVSGASLFSVNKFIHLSSVLGITMVSLYILASGLVVYRRGYSPAKYFVLAWTVLVIGILVFALQDAGVIPSNRITFYMLRVGSAVEAILLSIALADRINVLKKERSESQEQALASSLENERIIREQNVILEEKVSERTSDLENTNSKLSKAIGELKETQTQLVQAEKMASLGQLTAGVAHEINNPINFVSANIEPLRYDVKDILDVLDMYDSIPDSDGFESKKEAIEKFKKEIDIAYSKQEVNELLQGIEEGAKRTAEIVKGLKNFSRIDESNVKESDLNEGIKSTLGILRNSIDQSIKMEIDLDPELPLVECMGGKVNQVFMNIINNGLQAMTKNLDGKERILSISSVAEGDDNVKIRIGDTGEGMDEETKAKIFEPFFTTKDVGQGTGLGLSIVFKIIETHDGRMTVESEKGVGSTFTIDLPVKARIKSELEL